MSPENDSAVRDAVAAERARWDAECEAVAEYASRVVLDVDTWPRRTVGEQVTAIAETARAMGLAAAAERIRSMAPLSTLSRSETA